MSIILVGTLLLIVAIWIYLSTQYWAPDLSRYDTPQAELIIAPDAVSPEHDTVVSKLQAFQQQGSTKIADQRKQMEALFYREVDAEIVPVDVDGIAAEWVLAEGADSNKRLLYLHGGAFRLGSPRSHRYITSEISRRAGVAVLATDYRMQPEVKTIACHEDAQKAYKWILENGPNGKSAPDQLFVAGDSAGGNLTLSVIAWARNQSLRAADGAIALAPLTDATMASPTWKTNIATDPFLGPGISKMLKLPRPLVQLVRRFSSGAAPNSPTLSPLLGPLNNLPPILIQASKDELLYGDAQRYTNKAKAEGSDVTLQLWPKMVHVFQGFGPDLPEAVDALNRIGAFIKGRNT